MTSTHDVIVIGGGPAGLSAALVLGRCRRRVLVCDSGRPRNWASRALNGFLTRDGIEPAEFRRLGREQLAAYDGVEYRPVLARRVERVPDAFAVTLDGDSRVMAPVLLLATGQIDMLPAVEGAERLYGRGVFHCPICDGWENRGRAWAACGHGNPGFEYAVELLTWTDDLVWCTNGPAGLEEVQRERLAGLEVELIEEPLTRLEGGEWLEELVFASGRRLRREALFFFPDQVQRSSFPAELGCEFDADGAVQCDASGGTGIPGLYVAGNVRRGLQLSILAAAEGAEVACRINTYLHARRLARPAGAVPG